MRDLTKNVSLISKSYNMTRYFLLLLVLSTFTVSCDGNKKDSKSDTDIVTNYYFIRHAEKDLSDPSNRNPDLTAEGEARAERWKEYFVDKNIDAVYSTDYLRTMKTAEPTAAANNLEIKEYDPSQLNSTEFKMATKGKNVVVVGHSNTTPNFANAALGEESTFKPIDESEYYHLYHVTVLESDTDDTKIKRSGASYQID